MNAKNRFSRMFRIVARLRRRARTMPRTIALHERHVGALHGHVRPGLHGNPHVGLCQCRCVIDPVTGHGDDPTLRLQPLGPLWRIQELAEAQERMG